MNTHSRREQRPDPIRHSRQTSKPDVALDAPGYHFRVVSKEHETRDRVNYHKDKGYAIAKETNRLIVMACKKEEHEQRQQEAAEKAARTQRTALEPRGGLVHDETTTEVSHGLHPQEDE